MFRLYMVTSIQCSLSHWNKCAHIFWWRAQRRQCVPCSLDLDYDRCRPWKRATLFFSHDDPFTSTPPEGVRRFKATTAIPDLRILWKRQQQSGRFRHTIQTSRWRSWYFGERDPGQDDPQPHCKNDICRKTWKKQKMKLMKFQMGLKNVNLENGWKTGEW